MSFAKEFYFNGEPYLPTLQRIHHALKQPAAFVELVGETGAGKSSVCDKLQQYLSRKDFRVITFRQPIESVDILHSLLARELDVAALENTDAILSEALCSLQQPLVLIFDDAQQLSDVIVLELMRLAEAEEHGLRVLLSRQSSLSQSLQGEHPLKELEDRITDWFHLQAMTAQQFQLFLRAYFDENGLFAVQVEPDAEACLYRKCHGLPGQAVELLSHLLSWCLANPESQLVRRRQMDQIFQNHEGWQQSANLLAPGDRQRNGLLPVAVVVVVASLAFLYQQVVEQNDEPAVIQPSPFAVSEPDTETEAAGSGADAETDVLVRSPEESSEAVVVAAEPEQAPLTAQQQALARELARQVALQELAQEQVSDSGLALVTAEERGIPAEQFAVPEYEELLELAGQNSQPDSGNDGVGEPVAAVSAQLGNAVSEQTDSIAVVNSEEQEVAAEAMAEPEAENLLATPAAEAVAEREVEITRAAPPPAAETPTQAAENAVPTALLRTVVLSWLQAWESQSLPAYFARYHENFEPRYQDGQAAWRSNRERVIGNAEYIELQMRDFDVIEYSEQEAEVHFWLSYESGSYRDETLKKLVLVATESDWLIVEEVNLEVRVGMAPNASGSLRAAQLAAR
jgi:type II secretory pathway predicted ATPase ExeA